MRSRRRRLAASMAFCAALAAPAFAADIRLPDGPGANIVYSKCQTCHDLQYVVEGKGLLPSQWESVLASMHDYGLQISDSETKQVLQYLTTYLGPHPPPAAAAPAASGSATTSKASAVDGKTVYAQNCATCHGAEGRGQTGYFPPLAANPDLAADPTFPVLVVLNGLAGKITVEGHGYDGIMPALDNLSDAEIAAVVAYVRSAWGAKPTGAALTSDQVAEQRKQKLTPAEVHARRESLER